jgi:hypothetical protein
MYSTFLTASPGSVLFSRSNLLKRKDLCFSCLRLGLIRHRRSLRSSHLSSQVLHDSYRVTLEIHYLDVSVMHTKNILDDYGQPQVCSPLVPRKGNKEYVTGGVRTFLLDKAGDQHCLVENSSILLLQQSPPMGRAWCKSGVQKGSSLYAETFDAEIRNSSTHKMWILRFKILFRCDRHRPSLVPTLPSWHHRAGGKYRF